MKAPITSLRLKNFPLDSYSEGYLKEIAALPGVKKVVVMPDAFTKKKYEKATYKVTVPSSVAIATDPDILYPQFRPRGICCGMMSVALPFSRAEVTKKQLEQFVSAFTYGPGYYLQSKSKRIPLAKKDWNLQALELAAATGVSSLIPEVEYPKDIATPMEYGGMFQEIDVAKTKQYMNPAWWDERRYRSALSSYFGGNHYFELQVAKNVDASFTETVKEDQLVCTFHAVCFSLEQALRADLTAKHIYQPEYQAVEKESEMYEAFFSVQALLMNVGYATRFRTFMQIASAAEHAFGSKELPRILCDKAHNYTRKEHVGDQEYLVSRHNAEHLQEGDIGYVSGSAQHASFLVKGGKETEKTLHSVDHGLGAVYKQMVEEDPKKQMNAISRYRPYKALKMMLPFHKKQIAALRSTHAEEYMQLMQEQGIITPLATLNPLQNLKYRTHWK